MEELIGKRIIKIFVSQDQSQIVFETNMGQITYDANGDCCSESWFADITGGLALLGATVDEVTEVERENEEAYLTDGRTRQQSDVVYGYKFKTTKGWADIWFRNSSNGYYGGWLEFDNSPIETEEMEEITNDEWSA